MPRIPISTGINPILEIQFHQEMARDCMEATMLAHLPCPIIHGGIARDGVPICFFVSMIV